MGKLFHPPLADIVGDPGQQHCPQGRHKGNQQILDLHGGIVISHLLVIGQKPQHSHIQIGVDGCSHGQCKERKYGGKMLPQMVLPAWGQRDESADIDEIQHIGPHTGYNGEDTVYQIIRLGPDQQKHQGHGNCLDTHGTDGDIPVLFQALVQPFHPDEIEEQSTSAQQEQGLFTPHLLHKYQGGEIAHIHQNRHTQIDQEDLLNCLGQRLLIIPHLGAGPDPIGRNPQGSHHGEIGNDGEGESHPPGSFRQQDPGHIGKCDQREQDRGCREQYIHQKIFF